MDLLIEIKIIIASFDQEAWIKLVIWDDSFRQYAYSDNGRARFIELFTIVKTTRFYDASAIGSWEIFGTLHRELLPAMLDGRGNVLWYRGGVQHREDGPAVITSDGSQLWYQHGDLHRDDGPAIITSLGDKQWYQYGCHMARTNLYVIGAVAAS